MQEQRVRGGARPIGVLLMQLRMLDIERRILTWKVGIKTPGQEPCVPFGHEKSPLRGLILTCEVFEF